MNPRQRATARALIALAVAAATHDPWVTVFTLLYSLRVGIDHARRRLEARYDQEHPYA